MDPNHGVEFYTLAIVRFVTGEMCERISSWAHAKPLPPADLPSIGVRLHNLDRSVERISNHGAPHVSCGLLLVEVATPLGFVLGVWSFQQYFRNFRLKLRLITGTGRTRRI